MPEQGDCPGKGENLWKALYQLTGDIIVYLDGDTANMHPRFVTGLLGPLLTFSHIDYVKACYARPALAESASLAGGGRVTEILIRPLFSLFFPELSTLIQPLSGEYAARRTLLERLAFPVGYGVEVAHLADICHGAGLEVMAQVDLDERQHRHRSNAELGRMAFALAKVLCRRLQERQILTPELIVPSELYQVDLHEKGYRQAVTRITEEERPPMIEIEAYRARHADQDYQEQSGRLPAAQSRAG